MQIFHIIKLLTDISFESPKNKLLQVPKYMLYLISIHQVKKSCSSISQPTTGV